MTNRARSGHGLVVGILDPASLLGRDLSAVLEERAFPVSKKRLLHTAGPEGRLAEDDDEAAFVAPAEPDSLEGCAIAFACGSAATTRRFLQKRAPADGCLLIDLSGADPAAPPADGRAPLPATGSVVHLPDPTAWLLAETVRLLDAAAPGASVASMSVAVDRPVSELGKEALDELFAQSVALAAFRPMPKEILGTQVAFNSFHPADGPEWEGRVTAGVARMLPRPIDLSVFSARCGVFHGHHLRAEISFEGGAPPPLAAVRAVLFAPGSGFEESDPEGLSGPVESAGRDETLVLHLSERSGRLRIALASDHLRRPAALLAVRLAEEAILSRGLLPDA